MDDGSQARAGSAGIPSRTVRAGVKPRVAPPTASTSSGLLSAQIFEQLRDGICDGTLAPGARLVQEQLADELKVSRMPVREALLRLEQENYVSRQPNRGYVVRGLTTSEIAEVYAARRALEPVALRLALPHYTPQDIPYLRYLEVEATREPVDELDYYETNRRFHLAMIEPCPNRLIVQMITDLFDLPISRRVSRNFVDQWRDAQTWRSDHSRLLDAIESGDIEVAVAMLDEHLADHACDSRTPAAR
jgi:DNA-binding GntR family transcriptional regulator